MESGQRLNYELFVVIKLLPKRINEGHGSSWRVRYGQAVKWQRLIAFAAAGKLPKEPLKKAQLTLIRHSSMPPDFNGLVYSFKVVEDALVKLGVIEDDNMSVIGKPDYRWEKAKKGQGFVTIIVEGEQGGTGGSAQTI